MSSIATVISTRLRSVVDATSRSPGRVSMPRTGLRQAVIPRGETRRSTPAGRTGWIRISVVTSGPRAAHWRSRPAHALEGWLRRSSPGSVSSKGSMRSRQGGDVDLHDGMGRARERRRPHGQGRGDPGGDDHAWRAGEEQPGADADRSCRQPAKSGIRQGLQRARRAICADPRCPDGPGQAIEECAGAGPGRRGSAGDMAPGARTSIRMRWDRCPGAIRAVTGPRLLHSTILARFWLIVASRSGRLAPEDAHGPEHDQLEDGPADERDDGRHVERRPTR